ncbi:ExbD/TolR family protein [Thiocapsa bogorovii]|uniref:ExbD/TolR family protein n=1 Tax=Thiocapsa bogorovii TaxID=521689 RepID=UPI001E3EBA72|nr:biopolymer transporter ExbD [Thiocapsa bogorovii]UHD14855.1 biopolymer transporter ExbD [Thiocapsa bogorovii]
MRFESPAPRRRLIGLTPLIDVVFILLVFFMLASSLIKWQAVEMGAPASATAGTSLVGAWLVRVRPEGLDLNAEAIAAAELSRRVASRIAEDPSQRILIQPAAGVSLQRLVDALDLLRDAGATDLTLLRL